MALKLILFPLVILFTFTLLCQAGIAENTGWGRGVLFGVASGDGWFDSSGHQVCDENGTYTGEAGIKVYIYSGLAQAEYDTEYGWKNVSYHDVYGMNRWDDAWYPIYDTNTGAMGTAAASFDVLSGVGFIGIVAVVTALAVIASVTVFGSGLQGFSVGAIFKGTAFCTLWAVLTAGSWSLWSNVGIPLLVFFYLMLTFMYAIGVINSVGHPMGAG